MKKRLSAVLALSGLLLATGCTSDADKASENLSKAAEQFEVQRRIIGVNAINDKPAFEVEGRCSIEIEHDSRVLVVICKHGVGDLRKHYIGLADNFYWISTQLEGIDADVYSTRIVLKPKNIVPDFDLE